MSKATDGYFINISNPLHYDFTTDNYDVSPFTYTIVLQLANDDIGQYDKTLIVTQYPPLFIKNIDTVNDDNSKPNVYVNGRAATTTRINVWDNSGQSTTGSNISSTYQPHYLGSAQVNATAVGIPVDLTANNQNPNIYSVTTTILKFTPLANGAEFSTVLGDPRGPATDEYSSVLNGGDTGDPLTGYRPAAENTQNVISPKFISASSYGKTLPVTYEGAKKRCAAYQEYGYPAGRWRLPTEAEILFLQKLNTDNKIPSLFNPSTTNGYWAAGALLYVKDGSGNDIFVDLSGVTANTNSIGYTVGANTYTSYVRCVYDTWYWGENHSDDTNSKWLGYKTSLSDTF